MQKVVLEGEQTHGKDRRQRGRCLFSAPTRAKGSEHIQSVLVTLGEKPGYGEGGSRWLVQVARAGGEAGQTHVMISLWRDEVDRQKSCPTTLS